MGESVKLLLVLSSAVILSFEFDRDPWLIFFSKTLSYFEIEPPLQREEGSD
jgi:hypothetical protein